VNATTITATAPAGSPGAVSVAVTTPNGYSAANTLCTYAVLTPTVGEWGMLLMGLLLAVAAWLKLRRRDVTAG
jgi:predicted membrane-bound spermidine synthase